MTTLRGRRRFLRSALGAAAASFAGDGLLRGAAAQGAPATLDEVELRDDLTLVTGAGSNIVVLRAAGAAAVIDSGPPEHANELAKLVRGNMGLLSVELLFNTHWHPMHTGGNEALRSGDTDIVAHELTRLWMSTEYYVDWQDKTYEPRAAEA
ncbi:MAG: MBL fold metallo-hydrolase, partial [Lysobacterales bacterium]